VAELNSNGTDFVYATYLGGSGNDGAHAIALDSDGNAYITGGTDSRNLPTTRGALQRTYGGGGDAFVAKLNTDATAILYLSYFGGKGADEGNGIAVNGNGNVYITGDTRSTNLRTTQFTTRFFQGGSRDAFVARFFIPG
jgi:hypothetical protein